MNDAGAFAAAVERVRAGETAEVVAAELVDRMTSEERLGCLDGDTDFWPGLTDLVSGGYHRHGWAGAAVPRLGVPGFTFADGPRGVVVGEATAFPVPMARAATWDPALEERVGDAIGREMRRAGADLFGGVCINLLRHPGWGRAQETYGEDPLLLGEMGVALMRGVQRHVMACVKHFALNSMENARFSVDVSVDDDVLHDVYLPHFRRVVEEGVAVVMSAYNSVNGEWCGESPALLTDVLRDDWGFPGFVISDFVFGLRDPVRSVTAGLDVEMPFRQQRAVALPDAVADGTLDESLVSAAAVRVVSTLLRFADRLAGPPVDVEEAAHVALAREVARRSIVLLRNEPVATTTNLPPKEGARSLFRGQVRRESVLPLWPGARGRLADTPNLGDRGSSNIFPPSVVTPLAGLRAAGLDVVDDPADADVAIVVVGCTYEDEGEFVDPSTTASLGHLFPPLPTERPPRPPRPPRSDDGDSDAPAPAAAAEGFAPGGDRRSLRLRAEDEALVEAVAAANPRTVVVLMGGSAIVVDPWHERVAAILHLWYPGMAGGHALADVLTGAGGAGPEGRLPFAVPVDEADLAPFDPDATTVTYDRWHGQWLLDRNGVAARYPFGFGLSYGDTVLERAEVDPAPGVLRIRAAVRNQGPHPTTEVIQIYARPTPAAPSVAEVSPVDAQPAGPAPAAERSRGGEGVSEADARGTGQGPDAESSRPRRLVAFGRVEVAPGRVGGIELDVPVERLRARVDGEWSVEEGRYELVVGRSAADPQSIVLEVEVG